MEDELKPQEFYKYIQRDQRCYHCGAGAEYLVPHHRANRGMGGSKARDIPSNIISMCSQINYLMEADADWAALAKKYHWKISSYANPLILPVYDAFTGFWFRLDDNYKRTSI